MKRVFLIVLDSVGIGELPDARNYGDEGSNTLGVCYNTGRLEIPNMRAMGLCNIDGAECGEKVASPVGAYCKLAEKSKGKDTTIGHWEISGVISENPLPTYPNGFPDEVISAFEEKTGRKVICNKVYSGTEVIKDYGDEHMKTGALIVYTSADSVFQIAAHEDRVSIEELYRVCEIARRMLVGEHGVGRVIARPFAGEHPFYRTSRRHDYSLEPPAWTLPDLVKAQGMDSISVGKIYDIFAGRGFTASYRTANNKEGMQAVLSLVKSDFEGLCFVNLVDFDMVYGHRNDVSGYAKALNEFDTALGELMPQLRKDDLLVITADHGCDPSTPSTDHSREYTPLLVYGNSVKSGVNLGTRETFADIAATLSEYLGLQERFAGQSFLKEIRKD